MSYVSVRFEPSGATVEVVSGSLLLDVARQAGVAVDAPCGGIGRCGRCRVGATGALSPLTDDEKLLLNDADIAAGIRLACRARAVGDVVVSAAPPLGMVRVVVQATLPRPDVEPPAERGISAAPDEPVLGVAVDVGTTTLALALVDLRNGDELAHASALNPQTSYGADVVSRVSAALRGDAAAMRSAVVGEVERLATSLVASVGATPRDVRDVVIVGNTAMRALLLAEDVSPLAAAPYSGAPVAAVRTTTAVLGMRLLEAGVYVPPGVSAFIGGDVVAGLLVARPREGLYVDLGTNGEIVLFAGSHVTAASAAAGPALEAGSIEAGMRAEPGAIERVRMQDDRLIAETIGGGSPRGICGSGLLDLVALLLDSGVIDASGRMTASGVSSLEARVRDRGDQLVFEVAREGDVILSQRDVRELQLAKGAIRTAVGMVLDHESLDAESVPEVVIAGGFGAHVRTQALARLGIIPAPWRDRVRYVGNAALAGAVAMLVASEARVRAEASAGAVRVIDLAGDPAFQRRFLASLDFPQAR